MNNSDIITSADAVTEDQAVAEQAAPLADLAAADRPIIDYVDPADLYIGDNIRKHVDLPKGFLDSLAENGNTIAIIAFRRPDGVLEVVDGQRRTLGMIKRGVTRAKVEIHPSRELAESEAEAQRIVMQFNANEHTARLTAEERLNGIEQLLNLGHSVTKVSKKLGLRGTDEAKAAKVVAKSGTARDLHTSGQLTLEQAMTLTEFEDIPADVEALLRAADGGQFDGTVVRIRERREFDAAQAQAGVEWAERGFEVLTREPKWAERETYTPLSILATADGEPATAEAITDPVHWAVWLRSAERWRIIATGELVDLNSIDWDLEDDPDTEPDDGLVHPDRVEQFIDWIPGYYCRDLDAAGLHRPGLNSTNDEAGEADQAEAERQEAERRAAESAKLARTKTCNRAARAATEVRREFVTRLLRGRKTAPKTAMLWATRTLLANPDMITKSAARDIAGDLLGMSTRELPDDTSDNRAGVVLIGLVIGGMESLMQPRQASPYYWRNRTNSPGEFYYASDTTGMREYLRLLADLGHTLDDIESYVLDEMTLEDLIDAEAAKAEAN
ncbi:hypothetical protein [Nocardia asteroides]|uniref:hypothetical protein n=1 Tax=Nocardia asteroides TaxID=1824 RepID=UPI001E2D239C|nr:hypothetical protein [Nocardia asteroides]UGT58837.1 hypothetical protein LTT85_33335 [Nocardia asteroides]